MRSEDRLTFETLSKRQTLALTLRGEAGHDEADGIIAVGSVIINRARVGCYGGHTIENVCFAHGQFRCFCSADNLYYPAMLAIASNFDGSLKKDASLRRCLSIATRLIEGQIKPIIEACFYYRDGDVVPSWVSDQIFVIRIGDLSFYNDRRKAIAV